MSDNWIDYGKLTKEKRFNKFHANLTDLVDLADCYSIKIRVLNRREHIQLCCGEFIANYYPHTRRFFFQKPKLLQTDIVKPENLLLAFLETARGVSADPKRFYTSSWDFDKNYSIPPDVFKVGSYIMPNIRQHVLRLCAYKENLIETINHREFEHMIVELLKGDGYNAKVTQATRDNGKDIIAIKNQDGGEFVLLVECKKWLSQNVGIDIVQRAVGVKYIDNANHFMIVTTASFTNAAIVEAKKVTQELTLMDGINLKNWIKEYEEKRFNEEKKNEKESFKKWWADFIEREKSSR